MPKNHVLHVRITDDTHEKLTKVCNELGCSITDYVTSVLDESFVDPIGIDHEPTPKLKVSRISYDGGKTWIDLKQT